MKKRLIVFLPAIIFLTMFVSAQTNPCDRSYDSGDTDADDTLSLGDAISILNYLYQGGEQPECLKTADTNNNGGIEISDAIRILNYLFSEDGEPPRGGTIPEQLCDDVANTDEPVLVGEGLVGEPEFELFGKGNTEVQPYREEDAIEALKVQYWLLFGEPPSQEAQSRILTNDLNDWLYQECLRRNLEGEENRCERSRIVAEEERAERIRELIRISQTGTGITFSDEERELESLLDEIDDIMAIPTPEEESSGFSGWLDGIQVCLDVGGTAEPTPFCDLTNAAIYCARGQFAYAGISCVGIIPYLGDIAKGGKVAAHVTTEVMSRTARMTARGVRAAGVYAGKTIIKLRTYLSSRATIRKAYQSLKAGRHMPVSEFREQAFALFNRIDTIAPRELMTGQHGNHIINGVLKNYKGTVYQVGNTQGLRIGFEFVRPSEEAAKKIAKEIGKEPEDIVLIRYLYIAHHHESHDVIESVARWLHDNFPDQWIGPVSYNAPVCEDDDLLCLCDGLNAEELTYYCNNPSEDIPIPNPEILFGSRGGEGVAAGVLDDDCDEEGEQQVSWPRREDSGEVSIDGEEQDEEEGEEDESADDAICPVSISTTEECPECDRVTASVESEWTMFMFDPTIEASGQREDQYPFGEAVWPWQEGFTETFNRCCFEAGRKALEFLPCNNDILICDGYCPDVYDGPAVGACAHARSVRESNCDFIIDRTSGGPACRETMRGICGCQCVAYVPPEQKPEGNNDQKGGDVNINEPDPEADDEL